MNPHVRNFIEVAAAVTLGVIIATAIYKLTTSSTQTVEELR